jgi:hypothetical protein
MPRFIICYGWDEECDIIEADTKDKALDIATIRSMDEGMLDDDLTDTWAEEYTDDLAILYGLKEPD